MTIRGSHKLARVRGTIRAQTPAIRVSQRAQKKYASSARRPESHGRRHTVEGRAAPRAARQASLRWPLGNSAKSKAWPHQAFAPCAGCKLRESHANHAAPCRRHEDDTRETYLARYGGD